MAAPQVAGVVALLLEKNKNLDPFDVKVALTNTAKQLDTSTYNVFAQGAGLIQPAELIKEGTRAFVEEQYVDGDGDTHTARDRKSTRLNSSHVAISYAVFCLKKKKKT